jgi:hypothetical protein
VSREACLATALEQIEASEDFVPEPVDVGGPGLSAIGLVAVGLGTFAFFGVVAWLIARRTRARNEAAFDEERDALRDRGFVRTDRAVPLSTAVGKATRVLVRERQVTIWLFEHEPLSRAISSLWPERYALLEVDGEMPPDVLTVLRERLAESTDPLVAETSGHVVLLRAVPERKKLGRPSPAPVSLLALADLAIAIAEDLTSAR